MKHRVQSLITPVLKFKRGTYRNENDGQQGKADIVCKATQAFIGEGDSRQYTEGYDFVMEKTSKRKK